MTLVAGDLLQGRYRVGAALGSGGMGTVFLAREEPSGSERVVKQLRLDAPELLNAFRTEFALLSRTTHPHLVRVLDFGAERLRGQLVHYYVAEGIEGVTLGERAKQRSPSAQLLRPLLDALEGLAVLHDADIRHGDFTPANVLVANDGSGVLIDLGCAQPFGRSESLSGTEGYLAPELLAGAPADARADLFAVGQTLARIFELANIVPKPEVRRLLDRLARKDPAGRPHEVREVLEVLGRRCNASRSKPTHRALLGRAPQLERFEAWLDAFASTQLGPRVISVTGLPGSGVSRLCHELTWRAELRLSVLRAHGHETGAVGRLLATALGVSEPVHSLRGVLAALRVLAERAEPTLLVIEDHEALETDQEVLLQALVRSLPSAGSLAVLVCGHVLVAAGSTLDLPCTPLSLEETQTWASSLVSGRQLAELWRGTGGLPGAIEQALSALRSSGRAEPSNRSELARARLAIAALNEHERAVLATLWVNGGEGDIAFDARALPTLVGSGLVRREGDRYRLTTSASLALMNGGLNGIELAQAHRRIADGLLAREHALSGASLVRLIAHLAQGGALERAEQSFAEHQLDLRRAPRGALRRLRPFFERTQNADICRIGAELLLGASEPRDAVRLAARLYRSDADEREHALLLAADGLLRLGRPARVEGLLARSLGLAQSAPLLTRLARARLARGAYLQAQSDAEQALQLTASDAIRAAAHEVLGVACSYLGDLTRAQTELGTALSLLGPNAAPRDLYRIQSHAALVAFRLGKVLVAVSEYAAALASAETHDLDDLQATALLNLGTAEQQTGAWGSALQRYERGLAFARAAGRTDTEVTLEYNLANVYADIGALERADEALLRLEARVAGQRLQHLTPAILLLRAELSMLGSSPQSARSPLDRARQLLAKSGQKRELHEVDLRRAELDLILGDPAGAESRLIQLLRVPAEELGDLELALRFCEARVSAALEKPEALARLEAVRTTAQRTSSLALEANVTAELAATCERLQQSERAAAHRERARRIWDRVALDLPSALGALFWRHPRRAPLAEVSKTFNVSDSGGEARALKRLLALNRRLNSPHSLERVLDYALQASVDLTEAERGFLLLCLPAGSANEHGHVELSVQASTEAAGEGPSLGIVRRAIEHEEAVLTTDAQADARFVGQGSVHALQLKSVLCVPILAPSGTLGAIYVDSRAQKHRLSASDRDLLLAFADQVAVAIGNKRMLETLEQQRDTLERQKIALEQAARGHVQEVERLRREVLSQKGHIGLRYDYSRIIGRGGAMQALLERLDRITDSAVNVLVLGESGTGKELVARAIHWNGPRKEGPFLGINCAALPESLLESELFGHVRGAFTGADRDKLGLLQAANGGTLFLDEIGELPLATQAKLLRVLQEREVRPLGATASAPLDIRLLAATHRDLTRDVSRGAFREDLYYRIAVVTVQVPPLRERMEDLPLLATKILDDLARDAGRAPLALAPDAVRRLASHAFRGNVRELQNVLTRAFVLCSGTRIRAQDIDFGNSPSLAPSVDSRADFDQHERGRILEALRGARWNVSAVARSLGIPRVSLHRKLRKYGLTRRET